MLSSEHSHHKSRVQNIRWHHALRGQFMNTTGAFARGFEPESLGGISDFRKKVDEEVMRQDEVIRARRITLCTSFFLSVGPLTLVVFSSIQIFSHTSPFFNLQEEIANNS